MKPNFVTTLSLILAAVSLALSCLTLTLVPEDQTHLINDLYQENNELRTRIDELSTLLEQQQTDVVLADWNLEVQPWADSTGAQILFTASPARFDTGMNATLEVWLGDQLAASEVCVWDGVRLTCEVPLSAADGYGYYLKLGKGSSLQNLPLSTQDNPVFDTPVYLETSLSAFCNLLAGDSQAAEGVLTVKDIYAQVRLPQAGPGDISILSAQLLLRRNGSDAVRLEIQLQPGEVPSDYDAVIDQLDLPVGNLNAGDELELFLEVKLSDGRNLSVFGISWYYDGTTLTSAVG